MVSGEPSVPIVVDQLDALRANAQFSNRADFVGPKPFRGTDSLEDDGLALDAVRYHGTVRSLNK